MEDYVNLCFAKSQQNELSSQKRSPKRSSLPNLAGFCRYLKTDVDSLIRYSKDFPAEYGRIMAILEDEALNSDASATLITSYMKKRLNYEKVSEDASPTPSTTVTFEHDIFSDGE